MENKDKKSSIIGEAIADLKAIMEAADKSARDRMVKELPNEFEKLLKEEIQKNNKKESVKESVKDIKTKEPVTEGKKTDDDKKESLNEMEEIDMTELSIDDIEEAYNEASATDEFEISPDEINIDDVEKELESMEAGNEAIDEMGSQFQISNLDSQGYPKPTGNKNMQKEGENDPYNEKLKNLHKMLGEMIQDNEQTNEMHDKSPRGATAPADKGHNTTPSGINEVDINEAVSPELIQSAVGLLGVIAASGGIAALQQKLKGTKAGQFLDQMGSSASGSIKGGTLPVGRAMEGNVHEEVIDEAVSPELIQSAVGLLSVLAASGGIAALQQKLKGTRAGQFLDQLGSSASGSIKGGSLPAGTSESEESEIVMDETAGSQKNHAVNRTVGNENLPTSSPRKDSTQREFQKESNQKISNESVKKFMTQKENMEKRMTSLIEENKKLTKKVNESKENQKKIEKLTEDHKKFNNVLVKYRDQLSEMAVFNTNLASVNNILVNENLALTTEDKKAIINKFKNVKTITESEETYKSVLSEMKTSKKTLDESVENKVNDSIDKSSSEKVVEQTAYVNEHVNKIKDMMKYVDNHGTNRILR